jgi:hypothetical protein
MFGCKWRSGHEPIRYFHCFSTSSYFNDSIEYFIPPNGMAQAQRRCLHITLTLSRHFPQLESFPWKRNKYLDPVHRKFRNLSRYPLLFVLSGYPAPLPGKEENPKVEGR